MANYRIVCTTEQQVGPYKHKHIVNVGTGSESGYSAYWTVAQVVAAIDAGHVFYTQSPTTGDVAIVESWVCYCGQVSLKTRGDSDLDNNLDSLPGCQL